MSNAVRMFSGVESIRAAEQLLNAEQERKDQWPYLHVYPPANAVDVLVIGTVAIQAQLAAAILVVSYQVNSGKRFYLQSVLLGANVAIVPGQALFTIDRNTPIGVTNAQFMPEHGLVNIPIQLGSQTIPWRLQRAREFAALDTVRFKAANVALGAGDPNYWVCGLFGYEVPSTDIKANR